MDQSRPQDHNSELLLVAYSRIPVQTDELLIASLKEQRQAMEQDLKD